MSATVLEDNELTHPEPDGRPGSSPRRVLAGLASVAINFVAPLLAYYAIRPHTGSSALALALSGLIPVVYTLVIATIQRKFSALGAAGVALFGIGVLISWICGGNPLAMELQEPVVFGLFGLACLGHAVALIVLALTQSTGTFVALQRPAGLPFLIVGFGGLFFYSKWQQGRRQATQSAEEVSAR